MIGSLTRETRAQTEVLRQHHLGQQVLAEVIKEIMAGQQQTQQQSQQQGVAGSGPTATDVDDEDRGRLDFMEVGVPTKVIRTVDLVG